MANKKTDDVVGEIVKKKPRGGNNILTDAAIHVEQGDNSKYLMVSLELANLPTIDMRDVEQVKQRINDYFMIHANHDMKPTVAGLGLALNGMDRRRLWEIKTDTPSSTVWVNELPTLVKDSIKKAYKIMENQWENYMQNGKINPVSGIFLGKNNFGYQDKTEYVVTPNSRTDSDYDADEIKKRYLTDSGTIVIDSDSGT